MLSVCAYSLVRGICFASGRRTLATVSAPELQTIDTETFRTFESYPPNHVESHLGRVYTIPKGIEKLYQNGIPNEWRQQVKAFGEFGILIRRPAIEIISYLEQTDYSKPINKYVLYGKNGVGKTSTILHLVHYGLAKKYILLYAPSINNWFKYPRTEVTESPFVPGKLDLPLHAGAWLNYFKNLNAPVLSVLDLKVSKDYEWSIRETTTCGEPLLNMIEFGIQRVKFACGVIDALVNELKKASTEGKCRVLTVIDGVNTLTSDITALRDEKKIRIAPERISLTSSFLNSVDYNWCNGAAILSVDTKANANRRESEYPRYLLGKEGFELLDPFLPINVENYTYDEFNAMMEYYKDRKWVREISFDGQKELEALSNRNPQELWLRCKPL
ncbi:mitochondrial ribosomal protein S29 isoform X2 [Halictus rubicundus]|uniref:mitochondrial ribosomal protein S29 isoform X2 n=1 Tax=Halictus rubicundus TaxID=77578 RepID=UPI0040364FE6